MLLFGSLLIVAGWKNVSLSALARGDNTVPKGTSSSSSSSAPAGVSGPVGSPSTTPSPAPPSGVQGPVGP